MRSSIQLVLILLFCLIATFEVRDVKADEVDITVTDKGDGKFHTIINGPFWWDWDLDCIGVELIPDSFVMCLLCLETEKNGDSVILCDYGNTTWGAVYDHNGKKKHEGTTKKKGVDRHGVEHAVGTSGDANGHTVSITYN